MFRESASNIYTRYFHTHPRLNSFIPGYKYHIVNGGVEMRLKIVIRKALIALLVASVLVVPALMTSAEAQLYGSQYSQIGSGLYGQQYPYSGGVSGQQYPYSGGMYGQQYMQQPYQQTYPYGGIQQSCPYGYYYDQYRQQCVPQMMTQGYY